MILRNLAKAVGVVLVVLVGCGPGNSNTSECADGLDNDGDSFTDQSDPACQAGARSESDDPPPACGNGRDDDGDGLVDFPTDPGCDSLEDTDESGFGTPDCSDNEDNDGDGLIDFPADPGCTDPTQAAETDDCPTGPNCPQCADGVDNDADGKTDHAGGDPECASASDNDELDLSAAVCGGTAPVTLLPANGVVTGTLGTGFSSLTPVRCAGAVGTGIEAVYVITVPVAQTLVASTDSPQTTADTVLYLRKTCLDSTTELACNNDLSASSTASSLTVSVDPGTYFLIVDARGPAVSGGYELRVTRFPALGTACTSETQCAPDHVCRTPAGGSGTTCEEVVCSDGRDDDGDGLADFPADPGCTSEQDDTEADSCPGAGCPACANGIDDDGDGDADFPADDNCASASANSELDCPSADTVKVFTGNITGVPTGSLTDDVQLTCGIDGRDDIYLLKVPAPLAEIRIDTVGSSVDTALALRRASCAGFDLQCDDNSAGAGDSALLLLDVTVGDYFIVVDDKNTAGTYNLNVTGIWAGGALCDPTATAFRCGDGFTCTGTLPNAICTPVACNDNIDADGDGFLGFPDDPGCASPADNDEADDCSPTVGPACPVCSNDVDDDGDGFIDHPADPGCSFAGQNTELAPCTSVDPVATFTAPLTNVAGIGTHFNDAAPSCGTNGRDDIYRLNIPFALSSLRVDTLGSALDTVVTLRVANCGSADLACDDNTGLNGDSLINISNVTAGEYFIVVEDRFVANPGTYNLNVRGTLQAGGKCDPASTLFGCPAAHACVGAVGNEICEPAACNDPIDQDGDGFPGFPSDPGCTDVSDPDESDDCPSGPNCPACSNDVDDDGDTFIDFQTDPGCISASDTSEIQCTTIDAIVPATPTVTGATTFGRANDIDLSCGTDGRDEIYRLVIDRPVLELRADTTGSILNTVVGIRRADCASVDLACNDDSPGLGTASLARVANPSIGEYYIIVDDRTNTNTAYNLNIRAVLPAGAVCSPSDALYVCGAAFRCAGPAGGEICAPGPCNDNIDQDGDGDVGFPTDPGCLSIEDQDETDTCPAGPGCPLCGDGIDNDGDGFTDFPNDPTCAFAADNVEAAVCSSADPIQLFTGNIVNATDLDGKLDDVDLSCGSNLHDEIYRFILTQPLARLKIDTLGSTMDNAIGLRRTNCGGTVDLACSDGTTANDSVIQIFDVTPGEYFVIVDDELAGSAGTYNLNLTAELFPGNACTPGHPNFICTSGFACVGIAGAETCEPAACNDNIDQDGDGFSSFPTDPGCLNASDNDEADNCPSGPGCPICSNGLDDDNDGLVDFPADFGCTAASGDGEAACAIESDPVLQISQPITAGSTTGAVGDFTPTCQGSSNSDVAFILALPVPVATLTLDTNGSPFDTILMLTDVACSTQLACDDDGGDGTQSLLTLIDVPAGNFGVIVDGFSSANGAFTLNTRGTVAPGTACTSPLFNTGVLSCPIGTICTSGVCQ